MNPARRGARGRARMSTRGLRTRRGQALVEMCLCLPLLVILMTAIMHFGILFYLQISFEMAIREACMYAAYYPMDDAKILQVARASMPALVNPEYVQLSLYAPPSREQGRPFTLDLQYSVQLLKALPFGALLPVPTEVAVSITVPIVSTVGK